MRKIHVSYIDIQFDHSNMYLIWVNIDIHRNTWQFTQTTNKILGAYAQIWKQNKMPFCL